MFSYSVKETRRFVATAVLIACQFTAPLAMAQTQGSGIPERYKVLLSAPPKGSLYLQKTIYREIKNEVGDVNYYSDPSVRMSRESEGANVLSLKAIGEAYQDQKDKTAFAQNLMVKPTFFVAKTTVAVLGGLTSYTIAGPVVAAGAYAGIEHVEDKLLKHGQQMAETLVADGLARYREKTNSNFSEFQGMNPEQAYQLIFGEKSPIYDESLQNTIQEQAGAGTGFALKVLQDTVVRGELRNLEIQRHNRAAVEKAVQQIGKVEKAFKQFAVETTNDLKNLKQSQEDLQKGLTDLTAQVDVNTRDIKKNKEDIAFLQEFMYGKMSPAEQATALRRGMFGMPPEKRDSEIKRLEVLAKRERMQETATKILTGGQDLVRIARNLGINSDVVNVVESAVGKGQAVMAAAQAFASGNVLGAIANITGMFGGGARDIAGERHAEIMKALDKVLKGQEEILKALDQGFSQVYQNQQKILQAIVDLSISIEEKHREVMDKLNEIQSDVLVNRKLILSILEQDLKNCQSLIEGRDQFGYRNGAFPSYEKLVQHHYNFDGAFNFCLTGIHHRFAASSSVDPIFLLESYEQEDKDTRSIRNYRDKVFNPTFEFLKAVARAENVKPETLFSSLFFPSSSVSELRNKLKNLGKLEVQQAMPLAELLKNPLSVDAVLRNVQYLVELHRYFEILDRIPDGRPYTFEELSTRKTFRTVGKSFLERGLQLVDAAIAQQNLISGDALLPVMARHLEPAKEATPQPKDPTDFLSQVEAKWTDPKQIAWDMLSNNPVQARNLVLYSLRSGLADVSGGDALYFLALETGGNDSLLRKLTKNRFKFHYSAKKQENVAVLEDGTILDAAKEKAAQQQGKTVHSIRINEGWSAIVGGFYVPLPTADELAEAKLRHTSDMESLFRLKGIIIDELLSYDFVEKAKLSEEQKRLYQQTMMNGV